MTVTAWGATTELHQSFLPSRPLSLPPSLPPYLSLIQWTPEGMTSFSGRRLLLPG